MTLLTIIQDACRQLDLNVPNAVVSSFDTQVLQLLSFANNAGKEIAKYAVRDSGWSFLQRQFLFNSSYITMETTTTLNSNVLTVVDSTGVSIGYGVTGDNIPSYATVIAVTATTITIEPTKYATATATSDFTFSQISYALPSDYESLAPDTYFPLNNSVWWSLQPMSLQNAQYIKAANGIAGGLYTRFRIIGKSSILIDPYPTSIEPYSLVYVSNAWVVDSAGVYKNKFTADDDTTVLDEDLIVKSIIWRFKASKGLNYDEDYQLYRLDIERLASNDGGGARTLRIGRPAYCDYWVSERNVPEGNWPQ